MRLNNRSPGTDIPLLLVCRKLFADPSPVKERSKDIKGTRRTIVCIPTSVKGCKLGGVIKPPRDVLSSVVVSILRDGMSSHHVCCQSVDCLASPDIPTAGLEVRGWQNCAT